LEEGGSARCLPMALRSQSTHHLTGLKCTWAWFATAVARIAPKALAQFRGLNSSYMRKGP